MACFNSSISIHLHPALQFPVVLLHDPGVSAASIWIFTSGFFFPPMGTAGPLGSNQLWKKSLNLLKEKKNGFIPMV